MKLQLSLAVLTVTAIYCQAQVASPNTDLNARETEIVAASKMKAPFKIVHGSGLAQTPPMGWNSYDTYSDSVTEDETLANATWMQAYLLPFGWDTVVIDFRWYDPHPTGADFLLNKPRTGAALAADEFGRLLPAPDRLPSSTNGL